MAEDNIINQKVLLRLLRRLGMEDVDTVENGQLAVEASKEKDYDLILMDFQMPVMDGLEATRIINQRVDRPKIVFLSAHALQEYKDQAKEAGGDCFLSKPVKLNLIQQVLAETCQEVRKKNERWNVDYAGVFF